MGEVTYHYVSGVTIRTIFSNPILIKLFHKDFKFLFSTTTTTTTMNNDMINVQRIWIKSSSCVCPRICHNPKNQPCVVISFKAKKCFSQSSSPTTTSYPTHPFPSLIANCIHYRNQSSICRFSFDKEESTISTMAEQSSDVAAAAESFKLVGFKNFVRNNPKSDLFTVKRFHHVEFWCGDSTNTARRFSWGLGMPIVAKSDLSTGNSVHASYLINSGDLNFLFTAPYSSAISAPSSASIPSFSVSDHHSFTATHGLAVRAIAIEVANADAAFSAAVSRGAKPLFSPVLLDNSTVLAEVHLYGEVVLRLISYKDCENFSGGFRFIPGFELVEDKNMSYLELDYGIRRLDHAVGNVPELGLAVDYVKKFTGFHEFAEFTAEDVGTAESGLNSVVLANNNENVLLPMNEPVYGTKRKSQIQTYLEHNEGAGVQHLALMSEDIFRTLREMRKRSGVGGFEFMPSPPPTYYKNLKNRVGDVLTDEQIKECEELGILVDRDDQGTLLQIFTKPVGDRPTIFIEIIQRVGCMLKDEEGKLYQKGGCGGFGKGNFSELFRSIEEYEKMLEAKQVGPAAA